MRAIKIHCGACQKSFTFQHPSVNHAADLGTVTIDCQACGEILTMPSDELHMVTIREVTNRALKERGQPPTPESAQMGFIELGPDTDEYPTIGEVIESSVLEVDFKKRARVTPKVMPPHPPKPFARTSQERPRRPLTQRPFKSLDQVFDQDKD